mmetsp:Transcript_34011/g.93432  ORF Transcript_34011/g.93432 Transcript_34011/m.93432 type:complete len:217 (+) Transcript_34011:834-1484(+)
MRLLQKVEEDIAHRVVVAQRDVVLRAREGDREPRQHALLGHRPVRVARDVHLAPALLDGRARNDRRGGAREGAVRRGAEKLIVRADQVEGGDVLLAAQQRVLRARVHVAELSGVRRDDAADDHAAVPLVVEAGDGHRAFGRAHDDDAHVRREARQPREGEVELGASDKVDFLVERLEVLLVVEDLVDLGVELERLALGGLGARVEERVLPVARRVA